MLSSLLDLVRLGGFRQLRLEPCAGGRCLILGSDCSLLFLTYFLEDEIMEEVDITEDCLERGGSDEKAAASNTAAVEE